MKKNILLTLIMVPLCMFSSCANNPSSSSLSEETIVSTSPVDNPINVQNVVNMPVNDAIAVLEESGAKNIRTNIDNYDGWNKDRLIVVSQSVDGGQVISADQEIYLHCNRLCKFYLDLHSEGNLLFDKYDMDIFVDDKNVGIVSNGNNFTYLCDVLEGNHTVYAYKSGDNSIKTSRSIDINDNVTFSCNIYHGKEIEFRDESISTGVGGAEIPMPDVEDRILSQAMTELDNLGFINIREEPYSNIWIRDNWIVKSQSIPAGNLSDKNDLIQLDCLTIDDYFKQTYIGKNVNEIKQLSYKSGFEVDYEDSSANKLNDSVSTMDADELENIIVEDTFYYGKNKVAVIISMNDAVTSETTEVTTETTTVSSIDTDETITSSETTTTEAETVTTIITSKKTSAKSVYYSTNTKDTVKSGNSGIYSYKNSGRNYDIYYIIDFDDGYVYRFLDGNGENSCDKVKIDSGDLNDVVIITYHEGNTTWQNGLHFKWKNQPDTLIVEDDDHFEWKYSCTDIDNALELRDSKKIHEY